MRLIKNIAAICLLILLMGSCTSSKQNIVYMSDLQQKQSGAMPVKYEPLKIRPDDELVINVSSEVPAATAIYNLPFNNTSYKNEIPLQNTTVRFQTYIVNNQGDITFPVLGKIKVGGMTTTELADYLYKRISETVENPVVRVELVNFKVQVLGSVNAPGTVNLTSERVTILDAVARAGDLRTGGRRDNVLVMREENGEVKYQRLDLTSSDIVNSPYYYLKQNDVVYVQPNKVRAGQSTINENSVKSVSLWISIGSLLSSLGVLLFK